LRVWGGVHPPWGFLGGKGLIFKLILEGGGGGFVDCT